MVRQSPPPAIAQQIASNKALRSMAIDEEMMKNLMVKYSHYTKIVIPKEMYKTDAPVNTFYISNKVIVRKTLRSDHHRTGFDRPIVSHQQTRPARFLSPTGPARRHR